jgi:hypothetical protein
MDYQVRNLIGTLTYSKNFVEIIIFVKLMDFRSIRMTLVYYYVVSETFVIMFFFFLL